MHMNFLLCVLVLLKQIKNFDICSYIIVEQCEGSSNTH
jgi:hypothetical protein